MPSIIFPRLERIHLYSYLSCFNLIDVGWFEINDVNIYNIYRLINYNFDEISKIYDPSKKITEYNPTMINFYYWFSCLAYCDDKNIKEKNCCNNILNKWEIVFHKEYSHDKSVKDMLLDLDFKMAGELNPEDAFEYFDFIAFNIKGSSEKIGNAMLKTKELVNNNPAQKYAKLIPIFQLLLNLVYQYNFVILKKDEYKKIIVTFPGITYYFQILEEIIHQGMIELPIKSGKKFYNVMRMYYNIFSKLETDLFDNLASLPGVMSEEYQVIFVGHSIGGAIATLSSFYYIKKYNFTAENVLITFGQPKVGSEIFARELTNNLKQIYRIARTNDIATLFPSKNIDSFYKYFKSMKAMVRISEFFANIAFGNFISAALSFLSFLRDFGDIIEDYSYLYRDISVEYNSYSHIGGLYMIDDNTNKVYHCDDFFNQKRDHFICKNHKLKLSTSIFSDFFNNRNYLTSNQNMISGCQQKKLKLFRFSLAKLNKTLRSLEINNNNKINYAIKNDRKRKLNYINDILESLQLFKEINFIKDKFEFCYKYETQKKSEVNDLILTINPKNNLFFGEICFSKNISWIINHEYDLMNCFLINIKNPFALKIDLGEDIADVKEFYIYIKAKVSGSLELYDITKNITLNISSSYYIPYVDNFPTEKNINLFLPKIEKNIYLNVIINDYSSFDKKNISSIFEIYQGKNKIYYENNYLLLEKDNEYYFKYYPNQYELLINFIPIYSNKFLEKQFYIINEQNIYINYNIESMAYNSSFGLFFFFFFDINIKGNLI